jgi:predicted nucleic acid-binding protein
LHASNLIAVARTVLLDTGFLVALVNRRDRDHERCADVWNVLRARVVTVEGVLVEASRLLERALGGPSAAMNIVRAVDATIVPLDEPRLEAARALIERYRNVPMDFVDALLVVTAEQMSIREVLTLDRRGFEVYRLRRNTAFTLLPA